MARAVCFTTLSQGFLSALIRRVSETARVVFDYYSSPACLATYDERTILLARVIASVVPLHHMYTDFSGPLRALPFRLLRFQLDARLHSDGPLTDLSVLAGNSIIPAMKADISTALEMLRTESWGDAGEEMQVCIVFILFDPCNLKSAQGPCDIFYL